VCHRRANARFYQSRQRGDEGASCSVLGLPRVRGHEGRRLPCSRLTFGANTGRLPLLVFALLLFSLSGCERHTTSQATASIPSDPTAELLQTYENLRKWYAQGAYQSIRAYIDPTCPNDVIDLLVVVDELLSANAAAQDAIRCAYPDMDVKRFDMSALAENLELFSRNIRIVRTDVEGDEATLTTEIAGRLPLVRLQFQRHDGKWLYMPGQSNTTVIPMIREIAGALNQIVLVVSADPQAPEDLESEYKYRVVPKIQRMQKVLQETATSN